MAATGAFHGGHAIGAAQRQGIELRKLTGRTGFQFREAEPAQPAISPKPKVAVRSR